MDKACSPSGEAAPAEEAKTESHSSRVAYSPMPRGLDSQLVVWSKSHQNAFHILHVLLHEVLRTGGHSQDVPGPSELEEASAEIPSSPPSKHSQRTPTPFMQSNSLHPGLSKLILGDPKAMKPQRWGLALGPATQEGCYLLRIQPSQPHCLDPGQRDQSRKSSSQKYHLHSPRGPGTPRGRPGCAISHQETAYMTLSASVWVATNCQDIILASHKAK